MKKFGIRGTLPPQDPMRAAHLLGEDWQWERWYDTREARDQAYTELQQPFAYYRQGDQPSQLLSCIERSE